MCQSTGPPSVSPSPPFNPVFRPQLPALLQPTSPQTPRQTTHCCPGCHGGPLHVPRVNEGLAVHLRQRRAGGVSPLIGAPPHHLSVCALCDTTVAPLCALRCRHVCCVGCGGMATSRFWCLPKRIMGVFPLTWDQMSNKDVTQISEPVFKGNTEERGSCALVYVQPPSLSQKTLTEHTVS